jgi:ABC-type dipeptide/oligopeptide/nickel transport system permease component
MSERWLLRYVLTRLAWAVVSVLAILIINFLVVRLIPGDPLQAIVGDFPAPPEYVEALSRDLGLDRPLPVQLWRYLLALSHGDLGFSFVNRLPVLGLIGQRALFTLLLMIPSLLLAAVIGIALALAAAPRAGGISDSAVTALSLFGYSVPIFWLGQILIVLFAVDLGWLPAQGMHSLRGVGTGLGSVLDVAWHMILPVFCITVFHVAVVARVGRASVLETLHQDFVLTARGKGLRERRVLWRHVLPNALIPVVTVIGYGFGHSLTGAILTEAVFAWPGLGNLFVTSIANRDYAVLEGIFLLTAITVVVANLVTDLLYLVVDPRLRHDERVRSSQRAYDAA